MTTVTRTDGDTWGIASSVGSTAVMVAAARATETASADPLIRDDFAEVLIGTPELAELRANVSSSWVHGAPGQDDHQSMVTYQAVRTHFFDEYFGGAVGADAIRQVVILAAGLDSRAYRLDWPADTVVYEIDMPKVLEYKAATLAVHGAKPTATRREVAADLRQDWPKALRTAGFDSAAPTAWLAEGLLPFAPASGRCPQPGPAQDAMFASIDELSASGSRIAVEAFGVDNSLKQSVDDHRARVQQMRDEDGGAAGAVAYDPGDLWYDDEGRSDTSDWFTGHGWSTVTIESRDESERLGRPLRRPFGGERSRTVLR